MSVHHPKWPQQSGLGQAEVSTGNPMLEACVGSKEQALTLCFPRYTSGEKDKKLSIYSLSSNQFSHLKIQLFSLSLLEELIQHKNNTFKKEQLLVEVQATPENIQGLGLREECTPNG